MIACAASDPYREPDALPSAIAGSIRQQLSHDTSPWNVVFGLLCALVVINGGGCFAFSRLLSSATALCTRSE
ncbi:MAG: hypothetical protein GPOALKHO_001744 [Sodalis sp.]|nr:MAG: hypothetical protein GPOALKHO_001744 [Sodalis sp.]